MVELPLPFELCVGLSILGVGFLIWLLQPCERTPLFMPKSPPIDLQSCRDKWIKNNQSAPTGDEYLVIGAGFLGSRIIEALLQRGETNMTILEFDAKSKWASDPRVRFVLGDIRSSAQAKRACQNKQVVFFTAASIRFMDDLEFQWKRSYDVNVVGTQNVVDACIHNGVRYLIQTSSMMVNVPKNHADPTSLTEDMPYVTRENTTSHYATSKAMGEKIVRDANGKNGLRTISLRPCGIFGAKDSTMIEIMMRQNMHIFLSKSRMDFVYVDNVCHAHLRGEEVLRKRGDQVGGEAFYVSNEEPIRDHVFRRSIAYYANIPNLFHGPPRLFSLLAHIMQCWHLILRYKMPVLGDLEFLTPCALAMMEMDIEVDPTKSQKLLGYHPIFTVEEGVQLGVLEYQHNHSIFP